MHEEDMRLLHTIILQHLMKQPLILANPHSVRDFIYIQDVIEGLEHFARHDVVKEPVVNLGTGIQSLIEELV